MGVMVRCCLRESQSAPLIRHRTRDIRTSVVEVVEKSMLLWEAKEADREGRGDTRVAAVIRLKAELYRVFNELIRPVSIDQLLK